MPPLPQQRLLFPHTLPVGACPSCGITNVLCSSQMLPFVVQSQYGFVASRPLIGCFSTLRLVPTLWFVLVRPSANSLKCRASSSTAHTLVQALVNLSVGLARTPADAASQVLGESPISVAEQSPSTTNGLFRLRKPSLCCCVVTARSILYSSLFQRF